METRVKIEGDNVLLEGELVKASPEKAVVITHPHPLYGGSKDNSVVQTIAAAYLAKDFSTLTFNFRGVQGSTGSYGEGEGEQLDLQAALQYLLHSGFRSIDIAGYSFGSWIIYELAARIGLDNRIVLVSPPIDFIRFEGSGKIRNLNSVIVGSRDDFASVDKLQKLVPVWNSAAQLRILEGADHFYSGFLDDLQWLLEQTV